MYILYSNLAHTNGRAIGSREDDIVVKLKDSIRWWVIQDKTDFSLFSFRDSIGTLGWYVDVV